MTVEEMKGWVEDLAGKNRAFEEEVKSLKFEIQELTERLERSSVPSGQGQAEHVITDQQPTSVAEFTNNPLEIEDIVRVVVRYVEPNDLLKCRQVSKTWKTASRKDLEERVTFYIGHNELSEIRLFMNCAAKSFPHFRHLKLELDCHGWSDKNVRALFTSHGKYLHKLQLNYKGGLADNWNEDYFRVVFLDSLQEIRELKICLYCELIHEEHVYLPRRVGKQLPNLTILNIGLNCVNCSVEHQYKNTTIFLDILRMAPNLTRLDWRPYNYHRYRDSDHQSGSEYFVQSLIQVNPPKIEELVIHSKIPTFLVNIITGSALRPKLILFDCNW